MSRVTQAHIDARIDDIRRAAHAVFGRKGFDRATMQDIASEAGISAGAIYRYFRSKEDIISAMFEEQKTRNIEIIESVSRNQGDTLSIIAGLADEFFGNLNAKDMATGACMDLELWAEAPRNPQVLEMMRQSFADLIARFAGLIRQGQARGELRRDLDPEAVAYLMMSSFDGLIVMLAMGHDVDVPAYVAALKVMLGAGLAVQPKREKGG